MRYQVADEDDLSDADPPPTTGQCEKIINFLKIHGPGMFIIGIYLETNLVYDVLLGNKGKTRSGRNI